MSFLSGAQYRFLVQGHIAFLRQLAQCDAVMQEAMQANLNKALSGGVSFRKGLSGMEGGGTGPSRPLCKSFDTWFSQSVDLL